MKMYRKRFIPNEIIDISNDEVIYRDEKKLITKWTPINSREDFSRGESCVYFENGWKISKFYLKDGSLKYWYCDMIQYEYDKENDTYIFTDLLLDVIVYKDGSYQILDEDELEKALEEGIITEEIANDARQKLNRLVKLIDEGKFKELSTF